MAPVNDNKGVTGWIIIVIIRPLDGNIRLRNEKYQSREVKRLLRGMKLFAPWDETYRSSAGNNMFHGEEQTVPRQETKRRPARMSL